MPYFNEPGYESQMHSASGKQLSRSYNENIRLETLRWAMFDQLKVPSPGFEDVIRTHFKLKRNVIQAEVQQWISEAASKTELQNILTNLMIEIDRLL